MRTRILLFLLGISGFFSPLAVQAQDFTGQIRNTGDAVYGSNVTNQELASVLGRILSVFLSVIGVVLLIIIIYAGFLWMTAGGSSEQLNKAKSLLINGIIGLVILIASFAITNFVVSSLQSQVLEGATAALHLHSSFT